MVGVEVLLGERFWARSSSREPDCVIELPLLALSETSGRCILFALWARCDVTRCSPSVRDEEQKLSELVGSLANTKRQVVQLQEQNDSQSRANPYNLGTMSVSKSRV